MAESNKMKEMPVNKLMVQMGRITGIEAKNKEIIITEKNLKDFINILIDYKNNPINHGNKISSDDDLINIVKAKRKK